MDAQKYLLTLLIDVFVVIFRLKQFPTAAKRFTLKKGCQNAFIGHYRLKQLL